MHCETCSNSYPCRFEEDIGNYCKPPPSSGNKGPCEYWYECQGDTYGAFCVMCSYQYGRCVGCGTSGSFLIPLCGYRNYKWIRMDCGAENKWVDDLPAKPHFSPPVRRKVYSSSDT